ncbi:MAG: SDR family NAD(P)-dependent oxidoreductase [Ignavibacteria bacterium]|nr:SDR family NAD(P)-dependent oxidoreductase [Ignavibacteria bacterium]
MQIHSTKKNLKKKSRRTAHSGVGLKIPAKHRLNPEGYSSSCKLKGKVALITGSDSRIGSAVAVAFAKEGCDISIIYFNGKKDFRLTKRSVEEENRSCLLIAGDVTSESFCRNAVLKIIKEFGRLDIIVNNAAVLFPEQDITKISHAQLEKSFKANVLSQFYITKHSLKYLNKNSSIINTSSFTALKGREHLIDYSSAKSAIASYTNSLSENLEKHGIRLNGATPDSIAASIIDSTYRENDLSAFGKDILLRRDGQSDDDASFYLSNSSQDSLLMTKREKEVIELIAEGLSNKEIGNILHLSPFTIKSHVHNILTKTALRTRLQIAKYAYRSKKYKYAFDTTNITSDREEIING